MKDGLLKWDDLLGKDPEPGEKGHVAGVAVGDPVVLPEKLQKVIDNLQTAHLYNGSESAPRVLHPHASENASVGGNHESVNQSIRPQYGYL